MKGWDQSSINLPKPLEGGTLKIHYDSIKRIFDLWKDNKIVSFISTLPLVGNEVKLHQFGRDKVEFTCPKALWVYN